MARVACPAKGWSGLFTMALNTAGRWRGMRLPEVETRALMPNANRIRNGLSTVL